MKLLGIDYGLSKVGVAYSEGLLPSPLAVIRVTRRERVILEVQSLCERLKIEKVVVGLPGGKLDNSVRAFGELVAKSAGLEVIYVDETLSTKEAMKKMIEAKTAKKKRRRLEDAMAATVILNTYLESQI